jgi:hypothetical protein
MHLQRDQNETLAAEPALGTAFFALPYTGCLGQLRINLNNSQYVVIGTAPTCQTNETPEQKTERA